jgi:integrase
MRVLRAVYNRGMREHPELPPNPCANVDFHGTRRRRVEASADRLREWGRGVLTLSPLKRDLQLFMLLTGMRRTAAVEARIEHFDEERGCMRVPNPKGGESRAFNLPLSAPLLDLVRHRIEENRIIDASPWLFPSNSASGHVAEVRVDALGELVGHALRHVYATLALEAGVPIAELKFLLNHAVSSGGVTMGYLHPSDRAPTPVAGEGNGAHPVDGRIGMASTRRLASLDRRPEGSTTRVKLTCSRI